MKRIEAIIRPAKIADVCTVLNSMGHPGVTISAVEGRGGQQGWIHHVRSASYHEKVLARSRMEVVVKDEDAAEIIKAIRDAALTGDVGDGKIFVHDIAEVIRIRTNESGIAAL
jgi:nitrogen regulatory protein P-II 1